MVERTSKGWLAIGTLVVLSCGWMLWRGVFTTSVPLPVDVSPIPLTREPPASASGAEEDSTRSAPPVESSEIVVHVAGAVKKPGVVRIPRGSRVDDAVRATGGFSSQADPGSINLAQPLEDGVQVYVPRKGELVEVEGHVGAVGQVSSPAGVPAEQGKRPAGKININTATAEQLESLPCVGPVIARAIIEYRRQNGGFRSVEELLEVHGIGEKRLEQIRPFVFVR